MSGLTNLSHSSRSFGWILSAFHCMNVSLSLDCPCSCWDEMVLVEAENWEMLAGLLQDFCTFVAVPHDVTRWSCRASAAFLMNPFTAIIAPYRDSIWLQGGKTFTTFFFFISLASAKGKPWFSKDFREGGGRAEVSWRSCCCLDCCWLEWVMATVELCRKHFQIWVANSRCLASPHELGKPLQVGIKWHKFEQDVSVQW